MYDDGLVDRDRRVVLQVIDRADRAFEGNLAQVLLSDRVEPGIGFGDCVVDFGLHLERRFWPVRNREDLVRLLRSGLKIRETFDIAATKRKSEGGEETDEQEVFHRMVDGALNIV